MQKLTILNTREVKKITEFLIAQFGVGLQTDYAYLQNEKKRIYVVGKDLAKLDTSKVIIDRIGLYFGELNTTSFRLSKEGAQLLVREARDAGLEVQNVVELSHDEIKAYFTGNDLEKDLGEDNKFIILVYKDAVLGCASYKNRTILNFLPKMHRGTVII